jgi:hypothetical protein
VVVWAVLQVLWRLLVRQRRGGPITDTMVILHIEKKGRLMNTLEKFYIHKLSKNNLQLNDTYTDINNPIFDLEINCILVLSLDRKSPSHQTHEA